ncbi:MAG: PIN domain-containing protein [Pseudomonadota bacterium]
MGVSNELARPETDEEFEAMCHALYRRMWNDTGCVRMGGSGQAQFGIDILGHDGKKSVGVQCKHYIKKAFTFSTVTDDIKKAEEAKLDIEHLLFATTVPSKSTLVKEIHELSAKRQRDGKFTVSVDFWGELSGHIRIHPEIGRAYIPRFPGAPLLEIKEVAGTHLDLYQNDRETTRQFHATSLNNQEKLLEQGATLLQRSASPEARGDEADPRVVASLDDIRDQLREGKSRDALRLLEVLGDPAQFKDQFSRFRWHTNHASVALLDGRFEEAATGFFEAFQLAPDNEKAHANRAYALLLKKDPAAALAACEESLGKFPKSVFLWSLKLNARQLLGETAPEHDLPEDLRDTPELLFTRAHLRGTRGDYPDALELLRQCMAADGGSFEVKRVYLADALSWAALDPVLAHHGQLMTEQREALTDAIQRLEPLEQTLPAIQSDYVSLEVTNNVTVSLMLLGSKDRARALATHSLARHPLSEGLLRLKLHEFDERDDIAAIHVLTDARLKDLPPSVLGILAEISANRGELAWHAKVMAAAETSGLEPHKLRELHVLSIHARWMAGNRTEAVNAIRSYLQEYPEHVLARVILGQMLRRLGQKTEAMQEAVICVAYLADGVSSFQVFHVADLFFDLQQFRDAGSLYSRLVKVPGNDEFTRRLLVCLVESDQRRQARNTLDQLAPDVQVLPPFRRIEANLARRMGDWARMRDLLAQELEQCPDNSSIALGYVGALFRLGDKVTLSAYLASDPRFKDSPPEAEFEFAKYQSKHGLTGLALARLYRLYRAHSVSTQAASFYLSLLLGQRITELEPPTKAGPGAVVHLRSSTDTRVIAIDIEATKGAGGWPELVSPDSELAKTLQGLEIGGKVTLAHNFSESELEVVKLESLFSFVAGKAHEQVDAAAVPAGPLWSVRIIKDDGELDIDVLLKLAQQRSKHVRSTFENYQEHRFPISVLAKAIGSDPVTLLLDWPFREATLFVGIGTHEERTAATKALRQEGRRYVLDLLTIAEFVQRKSFDAAVKLLGRPLIPQTVREHLLVLMQFVDKPQPSASLGEQDGHLQMTDTPPAYYENREAFLREMLRCIDDHCEVVPTTGPHEVTDVHRFLAEILDNDSLDALYLCIERDAVLVSDDGALRLLAAEAGVTMSMGVQPVLMEACDKGLLSKDVYADAVVGKLASGHDFVSVRADDMLTIAKRTPARVSEGVQAALETFRKPTLDIVSGVQVSCEFLKQAIQLLRPMVVAAYGKIILEVLQHNRSQLADDIHRAVARTVLQELQQPIRKLSSREQKALASLLDAPAQPFRRTLLASAIHEVLHQ